MMKRTYQIEQVSYDIIHQAANLSPKDKSKLFGFMNSYVAVRNTAEGKLEILMETLGKRDYCLQSIKNIENTHEASTDRTAPGMASYHRLAS